MKVGWEAIQLSEVCDVRRGTTITQKSAIAGNIPVIAGGLGSAYFHNKPNRSANVITVSGSGANAGYVNYFKTPIFASDCSTIQPLNNEVLDVEFVFHFVKSQEKFIKKELKRGAAQPHVYPKDLAKLQIPLPPLDEQKKIVALLNEAFAGLDRARENAEANLKNARELFESFVENNVAAPDGCEFLKLAELADVVSGYSFSSGDFAPENPVKSIKITNVGLQEFVEADTARLPKNHLLQFERFSIPEGSIVIALTRTIISGGLKVAIVPKSFSGALLNQRVAALNVSNDDTLRDYLYLFLSSSVVVKYVQDKANTLMQPNLSINDLKALPVPNIDETRQKELVGRAAYLRDQVSNLQAHYQTKLQELDDLRQSLLHKAFAGELT